MKRYIQKNGQRYLVVKSYHAWELYRHAPSPEDTRGVYGFVEYTPLDNAKTFKDALLFILEEIEEERQDILEREKASYFQ